MADFDTGDIVRLGCVMRNRGLVDIVNVLHLEILSGGGLAAPAAYEDFQEYCDNLYATIGANLVNTQLADRISVANVTQSTVWGAISWDVFAGGGDAGDQTADQVALMVFGRTPISRVQIRKYLGVFSESSITDGIWGSAIRSNCQNYIDYLITPDVMTNGLELVGVAWSELYTRATRALTGATSAEPVIQRRRRRGRGS